jgi:diguanylate cyclase (GGDEF)-like protein/PAS domain S-box-containing protein
MSAFDSPFGRRARAKRRAQRWLEMSNDLLCETRRDGRFTNLGGAWTQTLGWTRDELIGKRFIDLVHPEDRDATVEKSSGERAGEVVDFENRCRAKDGTWRWLRWRSRAESGRIYAVAKDISARKQLEQERLRLLEYAQAIARTDPLTGLPNRRALEEELHRELARAQRLRLPLAVALLDLDHFKRFNDEHGHQAGDELLYEVAQRWRPALRTTDFVARYGGEEFGILLPACAPDEAPEIVERIRSALPEGHTCSAGLAIWDGAETGDDVVGRAEGALHEAKRRGRAQTVLAAAPDRSGVPEATLRGDRFSRSGQSRR